GAGEGERGSAGGGVAAQKGAAVGGARANRRLLRHLSVGGKKEGEPEGAGVPGLTRAPRGGAARLRGGVGAERVGSGADEGDAGGVQGAGAGGGGADPEGTAGAALRPLSVADHVSDPGSEREGAGVRGACAEPRLEAEVLELARGGALPEEQHALWNRSGAKRDRQGAEGDRGGGLYGCAGAAPGGGAGGRGDHGD